MIQLLSKLGLPVLVAVVSFIGGITFQAKYLDKPCPSVKCPSIPDCICNPPAVSIQPFDVNKIKNLKNFSYSPNFSGSISVSGVDSGFVKKAIDESITRALNQTRKK